MAISNDWTIDYTLKAIQHHQFNGTISVAEVNTVTVLAASSITTGDTFFIWSATDATAYYVWYNKAGGGGDPAPSGKTEIEVAIGGGDTADQVATATRSAINTIAGSDFTASGSSADVIITNDAAGSATSAIDGSPATGFTFVETTPGQGETVWSVNALYSYLMDTFDESAQMDDTMPMTSQTPTEYTLTNNWFIDEVSIKYLKGGAIQTVGWTGGEIVQQDLPNSYTNAVATDIGKTVTETDTGDTGALLFFDNTRQRWWIRPDDPATDLFDDPGSAYTIGSGTGAGTSTSASDTGENLWANIYTLGTIEDNTDMYVYQNGAKISAWWPTGHIDVLILVSEAGTEIDGALLLVFARQYSKLYDHFELDASNGGRNPIPLATSDDFNNGTGFRQMVLTTAAGGPFVVDEVITDDSDSTIKGVVTSVSGTNPNVTLQYYLIGNPLTDFTGATGGFTGGTSGATATAVAPTSVGPAASPATTITITFGATSQDINNGNGSRPYDVTIDCQQIALDEVYERLKYLTRRGETGDIDGGSQVIIGEQYRGVGEIRLPYDTQTVNFTQGQTLTGGTSGATGIITADHDAGATGALILRDVKGTFINNEIITDEGSGSATTNIPSGVENISPNKTSPFGTFAGGKLFGARGVFLDNVLAADAINYELIDSEGVRQVPPVTVSITVHVEDNTGTNLINANVFMKAADGTGDLPFEEPVTITRSGTLATVAHTAHGLNTGEYVKFSGIIDKEADNSGAFQITSTGANSYTYVTADSGATIYTGTILATGVVLYGLTDGSGNISVAKTFILNQPIDGFVRKSSTPPHFKTFNLAGNTINNSTGLTINIRMTLDE